MQAIRNVLFYVSPLLGAVIGEQESDFVRYRMRSGQAGWADFK